MTPPITGPDISGWQPHYDLEQVAAAGHSFIGIKATEGLSTSRLFGAQWDAAKSTPLFQFAYAFVRWDRENLTAQAKYLRAKVGPLEPGLLPPAADVEWLTDEHGEPVHLPPAVIANRARTFLDTLDAEFGVEAMLYMPVAFWHDFLCAGGRPVPEALPLTKRILWAAGGVDKTDPTPMAGAPDRRWTFRQWTGKGRCPGITNGRGDLVNVDLNWFAGSRADLCALARLPEARP